MKNYYEILGVAQTSDAETITAAFKALMQKLDSGTDSATAAKGNTKEFNDVYAVLKAHEVLIDPDARREYDASLAKAKPQDVPPPTPKIPAVVEEEEDVFVYPSANAFTEQQPSRWNTKIWLLPVLLLGFFLIYQIIQGQNSADPNAIVTVTVTGTANVRDAPTPSGSTVLGEYPPGTTLRGRWVPGNLDPSERWLELQEGGRFVWGRNLLEVEAIPAKVVENPPEPITVALDSTLKFADPTECVAEGTLEKVYLKLDKAMENGGGSYTVKLDEYDETLPVYASVKKDSEGIESRSASVMLPTGTTWHGLKLSRITTEWFLPPDTDSSYSRTVNFLQSPQELQNVLNRLGFNAPLDPDYSELSDTYNSCGGGMSIRKIPGGSSLICSWGC